MSLFPVCLPWLPGALYLLTAAFAYRGSEPRAWRRAEWGALLAMAAAGLELVLGCGGQGADWLGLSMCLLVSFLAWVVVRFSATYLTGEPGQARYRLALLLTLAAIALVTVSRNLGVLALAWIASSVCLHHLLTFYRDRAPALLAAHKKFVLSRVAELFLLGGLGILLAEFGTLDLDGLQRAIGGQPPGAVTAAMLLVSLAVILKSAQLPVHGWLIQVMEAPTPVSALLHAGVVNLGGFVMLRLAFLLDAVPVAQYLLVAVGGGTAALAGLIMLTRNSIKVRLAWSTCAQMGFMLLEIGLGLYALALLHLLAHSLYKAHAFLSSGQRVTEARRDGLLAPDADSASATVFVGRLLVGAGGLAGIWLLAALWQRYTGMVLAPESLVILALALAPLLWPGAGLRPVNILGLMLLVPAYAVLHSVFAQLLPAAGARPESLPIAVMAVALIVYALQARLFALPTGQRLGRWYPWLHSGFFLDEFFTRLVFRLWPASRLDAPRLRPVPINGEQA